MLPSILVFHSFTFQLQCSPLLFSPAFAVDIYFQPILYLRLIRNFFLPVQENLASSWIDGSVLYGEGIVCANCLRSFSGGQLATEATPEGARGPEYPGYNHVGIPMDNYPDPITMKPKKPQHMWSQYHAFRICFDYSGVAGMRSLC